MPIPITCLDNFYSDPDKIRDWALSLEYFSPNSNENFPGERTKTLHLLDEKFFDDFCQKLFSIFYDYTTPINWECITNFQKIYPYHKDYDSPLNSGWVHLDDDIIFAGVIYLDKNPNVNSGTSIFSPNEKFYSGKKLNFSSRNKLYHNKKIKTEEYIEKIQNHNEKFDLTLDVKNKYNRLLCYDCDTWHKETNFCTNDDFRLTQVFFIKNLNAYTFPTQRLKEINDL